METSRILFRPMSHNDFNNIADLDGDPLVMKFLTDGRPSTEEEVRLQIERFTTLNFKYKNDFGIWAAEEKTTSKFLGWFFIRPPKNDPDNLNSIELGYRLKRQFWRQGLATEGASFMLSKAFLHANVQEVFAITMLANIGSQKVMQKIGLNFECDYQEILFPGPDQRAVRYCLKKAEFLNKKQ